jgi:hypothetical protein
MMRTTRRILGLTLAGLAVLALGSSSCENALSLSATDLEVIPNPAHAGDSVSFVYALTVAPRQAFTITTRIDGVEHSRESRNEQVDDLVIQQLGDAADLISVYGLGVHLATVEVRLDNGGRTTATSRTFELQDVPPPPPAPTPGGEP